MRIRIFSQVLRAVAIALVAIAALSPVPARALGTVTANGLLQVNGEQSVKNTQTNFNSSLEVSTGVTTTTGEQATSENASLESTTVVVARSDIADTLPLRQAPSPATVSTDAELQTYAAGMLRADNNISKVRFAGDEVSLWYKQQAKLIGIIPVTLDAKATVTESGDVAVRYPWYKFLTTAEREELKVKLEARAREAFQSVEKEGRLSAAAKARLASELRMALAEQYELTASASGDLQAHR